MKPCLFLAVLLAATLLATGCGQHRDPVPAQRKESGNLEWVKVPDTIRVIEETRDVRNDGRHVNRGVVGVWRGPLVRDQVETAVRDLYEACRDEIEKNFPQSKERWVGIVLAADEASQAMGDKFVVIHTGLVPEIPPWPPKEVSIKDRDEATRLTPLEVAIIVEMVDASRRSQEIAERPFMDARGNYQPPPREKLLEVESERLALKREFENAIAEKHGLTRKEYDRISTKFLVWSSGVPATEETVNKWVAAENE